MFDDLVVARGLEGVELECGPGHFAAHRIGSFAPTPRARAADCSSAIRRTRESAWRCTNCQSEAGAGGECPVLVAERKLYARPEAYRFSPMADVIGPSRCWLGPLRYPVSSTGDLMRRREFVSLIGSAVAWPLTAQAQQPTRYRIGHLAFAAPTDTPPPPANWDAFVQGLREAGYTEGQNIAFEHRSAHDQPELFPKLAHELTKLGVDVIFARGTWALVAAKSATRTIPTVGIDLEIDPVEAGLVTSIARPGGNITGMFLDLSELSSKHLQFLKEIIPGLSRVAILGNSDVNASQLRELDRIAGSLSVDIRSVDVKAATDLDGAFDAAKNWRADALIVLSNPLSLAHRTRIGELATKAGLPTIHLYRAHVDAGGLISYGPDLPDMFRRCGGYVGRILRGAKPADLPIERPARFELVVNLKTAKALGLTVHPTLIARADEVIE
jgi:putative ABC transport system substrate-binding protein